MKKQLQRAPRQPSKAQRKKSGHAQDANHKQTSTAGNDGKLRGWKAIADFLALPVNIAQRWAKGGMPVHREGRFTVADPDDLRQWLGRESEMPAPAHIAVNTADLATGLRESISAVRRQKRNGQQSTHRA
jgi:hypothetical protein